MGILHEECYTFLIISHSVLLRMRSVSEKSCRESQNTHFMFKNFFQKSCCLIENVEKYCGTWEPTDDNKVHAHCMLDTEGYKHTLKIYTHYWFSTATMVAQTHVNIMLYVQCLSCCILSTVVLFLWTWWPMILHNTFDLSNIPPLLSGFKITLSTSL